MKKNSKKATVIAPVVEKAPVVKEEDKGFLALHSIRKIALEHNVEQSLSELHMVRGIQLAEGNSPCFASKECENSECLWQKNCQKMLKTLR